MKGDTALTKLAQEEKQAEEAVSQTEYEDTRLQRKIKNYLLVLTPDARKKVKKCDKAMILCHHIHLQQY